MCYCVRLGRLKTGFALKHVSPPKAAACTICALAHVPKRTPGYVCILERDVAAGRQSTLQVRADVRDGAVQKPSGHVDETPGRSRVGRRTSLVFTDRRIGDQRPITGTHDWASGCEGCTNRFGKNQGVL